MRAEHYVSSERALLYFENGTCDMLPAACVYMLSYVLLLRPAPYSMIDDPNLTSSGCC